MPMNRPLQHSPSCQGTFRPRIFSLTPTPFLNGFAESFLTDRSFLFRSLDDGLTFVVTNVEVSSMFNERWNGVIVDCCENRGDRRLTGALMKTALARSVHLPPCPFAKPEKLFQMMLPMHQMKLSPLRRTQRAQNRMVE